MRIQSILTLLLLVVPVAGNAEISLGGLKERASKAAKAVGETAGGAARDVAGEAAGAAKETIDSTKNDLQDEATPEATRAELDAMAETTLARLFTEQPASRDLFEDAGRFAEFVGRGMDASAQVGTMSGQKKDELRVQFSEGKALFVLTKKGWKIAA